jgi:hypothetical protein
MCQFFFAKIVIILKISDTYYLFTYFFSIQRKKFANFTETGPIFKLVPTPILIFSYYYQTFQMRWYIPEK